jgi:hypothetical protein
MLKQFAYRLKYRAHQVRHGRATRKIFFMHLPKCGGTSINSAIRNSFITLNPANDHALAHLDPVAAHKAALLAEQDPLAYTRDLSLYFLGCHSYRYVAGHFSFSEAAYAAYRDEYLFMTLLRDPVEKWLSLYFYNRYKKSDFFRVETELEEFIHSPMAVGYGCDYVMQFAGDFACSHVNVSDYTTPEAAAYATKNLCKFHLVGCLDRLDLFVGQFQRLCGVALQIPVRNRNPLTRKEQKKHLSAEVMDKIQELCKPNYAIYNYATKYLLNGGGEECKSA